MSDCDWPAEDYAIGSTIQRTTADLYLDQLVLKATDRVLDIGCGDGAYTRNIIERVPEGAVLGIDSSESMLQLAREKADTYPNFSVQLCDAETMTFEEQFDQVVSFWCLQWTHDIVKAFSNIHRALKPGGQVMTLFPAGDDPFINHFYRVRDSGRFACLDGFKPPMDYRQMEGVDRKLEDLAFSSLSVHLNSGSLTLESLDVYRKFVNGIAFFQGQLNDEDRQAVDEAMVESFERECQEKHHGEWVFDMKIFCVRAEK